MKLPEIVRAVKEPFTMIEKSLDVDNGAHHRRLTQEISVQNSNVQRIASMAVQLHKLIVVSKIQASTAYLF